jgi:hypothetical protein
MHFQSHLMSTILILAGTIASAKDGDPLIGQERTSVRFAGPNGMKVSWYFQDEDGKAQVAPTSLEVPARYNFSQANIYRLKLSNIPSHPGLELDPTLEIVPGNSRTSAFLKHSSVPLVLREKDLEWIMAGKSLVKIVYLPRCEREERSTEPGEINSSELEQDRDPLSEAISRGSILVVLRLGKQTFETAGLANLPPGAALPGEQPPSSPLAAPASSTPGWHLSNAEGKILLQTADGLSSCCEKMTLQSIEPAEVSVADNLIKITCGKDVKEGDFLRAVARKVSRTGAEGSTLVLQGNAKLEFIRKGKKFEAAAEVITVNLVTGQVVTEMGEMPAPADCGRTNSTQSCPAMSGPVPRPMTSSEPHGLVKPTSALPPPHQSPSATKSPAPMSPANGWEWQMGPFR